VRDLRGQHLPLLKQLRKGCLAELRTRYGVPPASLRVYMHYLPTFWWAHVHFAALTCPAMGASAFVGKAILLDDIIDNLVTPLGPLGSLNSHHRRTLELVL